MPPCELGVVGAGGRLGARIAATASELGHRVTFVAGRNYWRGGIPDVLIDVSVPEMLPRIADFCAQNNVRLLSAVSGLTECDLAMLAALGRDVAVLRADNLSLGHYLQKCLITSLATMVAATHPDDSGWHVVDRHPATKRHRPSATAEALAQAVRSITGAIYVGVDSVRGGLPVCDHTVETVIGEETVAVLHSVRDWSAYATSAAHAAQWLYQVRSQGLLTMDDFYGQVLAASPHLAALTPKGARP
jgi:4-hydroxy-tetrahydrodipicolinate reductase